MCTIPVEYVRVAWVGLPSHRNRRSPTPEVSGSEHAPPPSKQKSMTSPLPVGPQPPLLTAGRERTQAGCIAARRLWTPGERALPPPPRLMMLRVVMVGGPERARPVQTLVVTAAAAV
eukprot:COSAG05_NODE_292_length_12012_cov_12.968354_9_plen_117_part_00